MRQLTPRAIGAATAGLVLAIAAPRARADDMAGMDMSAHTASGSAGAPASSFGASVSLVAASYAQQYYGGDYEGVVPALSYARGRWSASASLGLYRIFENGIDVYGPGDLMLGGTVALYRDDALRAGLAVMFGAPTGDMEQGFGMGGPMLMPSAWAAWTRGRYAVSASAGWGGMLSGGMTMNGAMMMAIVAPMNESELEWSAAVDVALGGGVHGGVKAFGGVPVGDPGTDRAIGAVRVAWGKGAVDTGAEVQAGIAGDPFTVRGVVDTALHF